MKKIFTIICVAIITFAALNTRAQDDKKYAKSYIGFYGGISQPLGDFARSAYYNNSAGFAKRGPVFGLDGAYYFYKNLGIGVSVSWQDQGELSYTDVMKISTGYTTDFKADGSSVTAVNRYTSLNALLGPQYTFLIKKFTIDLRAEAGVIKSYSTPDIETTLTGAKTQTKIFTQQSTNATILGYGANVGFRYNFAGNWSIGLKGSYINSQGFKINNINHEVATGRLQTKLPVTEVQGTLGISVAF